MLLIAGLGNPGAKHERNRHNVGFMAADRIARRLSLSSWSKKFQGLVAEGSVAGHKVVLLKPQTFMNLSGQSVGEALRFYKLNPDDLLVVYDEIDLPAGKVRVKKGGGSGGHNGIRSIDAHVGDAYRRLRIGIGHPGDKARVHGHVLGDFAKADAEWLDPLLDAVADHFPLLVEGDDNGFMNKISVNAAAPAQTPARKQSHIRQARPASGAVRLPESGPMAAMLKKLFGKDQD